MGGRRNCIDIAAAILTSVENGAAFTKILNGVRMSTPNTRKHIAQMEKSGLLEYHKNMGKYFISAKGKMFMEIHDQMTQQAFVLRIIRSEVSNRESLDIMMPALASLKE